MVSHITRRQMLAHAAGIGAAAMFVRHGAAAEPVAQVHEMRTISWQRDVYHGWPTVTRRRDGELLLVYSGGRHAHVCPFGRVELMRSGDDGKTWSWPRVLADSAIDDRDAGVIETAKGTLLVTTFTSLAYERLLPKHGEQWAAAHNRLSAEQRHKELGQWIYRSTDGGVTWSARYASLVNSPHGPIQLADGRLLYAGKELWTGDKRVGVCESTDDGATWTWLAEIPARPGDDAGQYHELHAVETADGRLVCHIRNHNKANAREILQTESTDGGRTWSTPHPIGVWGLPSHLLRLRDGRLLMTYGHRRKPFGNQARLSADGGLTWSGPLTISADGAGGDLGYPSTVQLDDRKLLTVWYERPADSDKAQLRQATWSIES
ncbi:exo-alpha-sialidase [Planctomycetales bacterium ZRK34]|nr:exo-alpha-sialidase [Planctomycetales bacterium ZRK34]